MVFLQISHISHRFLVFRMFNFEQVNAVWAFNTANRYNFYQSLGLNLKLEKWGPKKTSWVVLVNIKNW